MRFYILIAIILTFQIAYSQDYIFEIDKKDSRGSSYIHHVEGENEIYYSSIRSSKKKFTYSFEYKLINTENFLKYEHRFDEPIVTDGKILNVFCQLDYFYLLETNKDNRILKIHSYPINKNKKKIPARILGLLEHEKVLSVYFKNDQVYIFTINKKTKNLRLYIINPINQSLEKIEVLLEKSDFNILKTKKKDNKTISIIDYDNFLAHNALSDITKIFFEENKVLFYILDANSTNINLYSFDLIQKKSKQNNYKFSKGSWTSIGGMYHNGKLYKIGASKYDMSIEVIDVELSKTLYVNNTAQANAYPFDFQSSNAISHLYPKIDDRKAILKRIGKNIPVLYPEVFQDEVKFYVGSVESTEKYNAAAIGIAGLIGFTGFYLTGDNILFFLPGTQYTYTEEERGLGYVFFETKLNENGELQSDIIFKDQIYPKTLKVKHLAWKMEKELKANCIMIYKNQNNFYGTYISDEKDKLLIRKIDID